MTDWITNVLGALDAVPTWQLYTLAGVLLMLETTALVGLVTPGEVVLLAVATTVSTPGEFFVLVGVAAGASFVGQSGGYLIGRRFGHRFRDSRAGRWIGATHWDRAEAVLSSGRGRVLVGSRFLAVAHSLVPVLAGTLRMPWRRFACYTTLGVVAWGLVYVGLGSAASAAVRGVAHLVGPAATAVVVAAVLVALAVRMLRRRNLARAGV